MLSENRKKKSPISNCCLRMSMPVMCKLRMVRAVRPRPNRLSTMWTYWKDSTDKMFPLPPTHPKWCVCRLSLYSSVQDCILCPWERKLCAPTCLRRFPNVTFETVLMSKIDVDLFKEDCWALALSTHLSSWWFPLSTHLSSRWSMV